MQFGKRLKNLRKERDLTQQDIANVLGVGRATIAGYETKGKQPDYEKLNQLANYFNTSVDYLLGRTDIRKPDDKNNKKEIPDNFETPEEAMKFILEQNVIMGFGGFDVYKMSDEEVIEFANELLNQLRILSYKYKK